ncbi:MAG: hypothetical protein EXR72_26770, partial [Myxococcales bacterium]|nr:hypothetical protein [Myxococcales bacterium]
MARAAPLPEHRVCVEFLPHAELARPAVVRLLTAHNVAPMLAVRPGEDEAALSALAPYLDAGLAVCAWPLLDDGDGYWPSETNVAAFAVRVSALLAAARRRGLTLPWLAVDLEPRFEERDTGRGSALGAVPRVALQAWRHLDLPRFARATREYAALHKTIAAAGTRALAIAWPFVSADFATGSSSMQDLCEAPLGCGWDRVAIMTYGSLIAGYSRGMLTTSDVRWYGYRALARLGRALGPRSGAFIGLTGSGKLGDEPAYQEPRELALDAAAARAAGVGEVSLFCLEGILARPDPEV